MGVKSSRSDGIGLPSRADTTKVSGSIEEKDFLENKMRIHGLKLLAAAALLMPFSALGADVSLVSGLYKKESDKIDGKTSGSTSTFGLGGRYHDDMGESLAWYGVGSLSMHSYSAPDGLKSPDNGMSILAGGGLRHYFKPFATAVVPYGSAGGDVRNIKSVNWQEAGYDEITLNGLYYNAAIGLRTGLDSNIFVEFELPLFDRALFAVAKKVSVRDAQPETKEETTYNELWVTSFEEISRVRLAIGYQF